MDFSGFQFSDAQWLWGLAAIPAVALLYHFFYRANLALERLKPFADAHLLPHLVKNRREMQKPARIPLIVWSLIWACGALAMAGPRWDYKDVEAMKPDRALVILLDLSASMDAQDVKPSRVARAREKVQDILDMSRGVNIGLVAFAAIPHMIAPLTDDMATIRNFVPALDTKLVYMQGSHLAPALHTAIEMLDGIPGKDKSILVISDGGFKDDAVSVAREANGKGITVHAMGVGTAEGAPIPIVGGWIKDRDGTMVVARLETDNLQALAKAGHGLYVTADYTDNDTRAILDRVGSGADNNVKTGKMVRVWDEKFYIPALLMALLVLPWFRRGYVFPVLLLLVLSATPSRADTLSDMFLNPAQQGRAAYDQGDYKSAEQKFDTPYRRGVAQYKAGEYDKAIESFNAVTDPATKTDSEYNRGNAQLMAGKVDDAIASYESVLKERPGDKSAQRNLDVAKKIKDQQQQQQQQQQKKDSSQSQKQGEGGQSQNQQQGGKSQSGQQKSTQDQQQKGNDSTGKQDSSQNQKQAGDNKSPDQGQQPQDNKSPPREQKSGQDSQTPQQKQGDKDQKADQQPAGQDQQKKEEEQKQAAGAQDKDNQDKKTENAQPQADDHAAEKQPEAGQPDDKGQDTAQLSGDDKNPPLRRGGRHTPKDVDADQWLSRAESDPAPLLKNQFMIETLKSGVRQEDDPW